MFVPSDVPKYVRGITACAVLYCVEFCCMGPWRFYCKMLQCSDETIISNTDCVADIWENRRRGKMIQEQGISMEESERLGKLNAEADMTDRENIHFRYKY